MARTATVRQLLDQRGAVWKQTDDDHIVDHYGDPDDEYGRLVDGEVGLIERGRRQTLVIQGPDAVPWLQGLVTNDLHRLAEQGSGQRNSVVNKTGRFVADLRILHLPQLLVIDLEPGLLETGLWSHLRGQIIREDVEISDRSEATGRLGVYGQPAAKTLENLGDWEHAIGELSPFNGTWCRLDGRDLIVQRTVWADIPGYELICPADEVADVIDRLESQVSDPVWFGHQTFETLRVEAGIPRFGVELDDRVIPLEAGFDDAISFEKGCYLGQEIIARLDTRGTPAKQLRRIIFDGDAVPQPGADIHPPGDEQGRAVGTLKSAVWSPRFDAPVGLGFVKRNHNDIGNTVVVDGQQGRLEEIFEFGGLTD